MTKIEQIQKMLDILSKDFHSGVRKVSQQYHLDSSLIKVNDPDYKTRSYHQVTADFDKKELSWTAWEESGHNGSSYDQVYGTLPWNDLENNFDVIYKRAAATLTIEVLKEEEELRKKMIADVAVKKLNYLIGYNQLKDDGK